jgi:hypothetical protein
MVSILEDGIFWISFVTLITGCLLAVVKITYKSKCREVECCCIKIKRDIDNEEKIDEIEMNRLRRIDTLDEIPKLSRSQNQV